MRAIISFDRDFMISASAGVSSMASQTVSKRSLLIFGPPANKPDEARAYAFTRQRCYSRQVSPSVLQKIALSAILGREFTTSAAHANIQDGLVFQGCQEGSHRRR
jgi:hypothetical protein